MHRCWVDALHLLTNQFLVGVLPLVDHINEGIIRDLEFGQRFKILTTVARADDVFDAAV